MSSKFSIVKRIPGEKPSKKRIAQMNLEEFRWWKYCHLRSSFGFMFDSKRMNDIAYMDSIRPWRLSEVRGSSKGYSK